MTFTPFKIFLFLHIAFIIVGMGTAVFFHLQFVRKNLPWSALKHFFKVGSRVILIGIVGAILTGVVLWILKTKAVPPLFYGKLALVAMLLVDGSIIHFFGKPRLEKLLDTQTFNDLSVSDRRVFYVSGFFSVLGWWGALFIAFFK